MSFLDQIINGPVMDIPDPPDLARIKQISYYRKKYEQKAAEGKPFDLWEFESSVDRGWPYPVATEAERELVCSSTNQPLRGNASSILLLIKTYLQGQCLDSDDSDLIVYPDQDKVKFWKDILISGAENGNRLYQAALITGLVGLNPVNSGWMSVEEGNAYKEKFESSLIRDALAGDGIAAYAVAAMCVGDAKYGSNYRSKMTQVAMNAGIADAYYLGSEIYRSYSYSKDSYSYGEILRYYMAAKDCTSGAMLGVMQYFVGDAYSSGEEWVEQDLSKAIYYYRLALKNGMYSAASSLELLQQRYPQLFLD